MKPIANLSDIPPNIPADALLDVSPNMRSHIPPDTRHPFLLALGARVRWLRAKQGLTRKQLAVTARISERHLANLEGGTGNVSVLILVDLAKAFDVSVPELLASAHHPMPRMALEAGSASASEFGFNRGIDSKLNTSHSIHPRRIALIGLRGAGKSTLGGLLAKTLGYRFIETSREIESLAGCDLAEIYNLYGEAGYRRFERQAIKDICTLKDPVVIATPGGIVSNADTFELLLRQCTTVWLQAKPLDHLSRVRAQGDNRPMAATRTTQRAAIDDLKSILQAREPEYAKANFSFDTSGFEVATCEQEIVRLLTLL
jgi:XRE family transcriptional regulator, aerobic/anaerobic benzoate catabolism transcriptional regulator